MVTLSQAAGASAMYFFTGSLMFNFPRSSSNKMEAAVNCLVIDPSRNLVVGELGMSHSKSAEPYPLSSSTVLSRTTSTEPMNVLFET